MNKESNRFYWVGTHIPEKGLELQEEAMFYAGAKKVKMTEESVDNILYQDEAQDFDLILAVRSENW